MRLIKNGEKVRLGELEAGTIFAFGKDCIAVKSEYFLSSGKIEAVIVDSGEFFHGGASTVKEQWNLWVQPMEIEPVQHGRWIETLVPDGYVQKASRMRKECSVCGWTNACRYKYCPNCGAKMDKNKNT